MDAREHTDPALAAAVKDGCQRVRGSMPKEVMASRARIEARQFMHGHPRARLYLIDGNEQYARAWGTRRKLTRRVSKGLEMGAERKTPDYEHQLALDDRAESHLEAVAGYFLARDYPAFKKMVARTLSTRSQNGVGRAAWSWVALYAGITGQAELEVEAHEAMCANRLDSLRLAGMLGGAIRSEMLGMSGRADDFSAQLADEDVDAATRVYGLVREMNVRRHGEPRVLMAERGLRSRGTDQSERNGVWYPA